MCRRAFESLMPGGDIQDMGRMLHTFPMCRLDPWTADFVRHYGEQGLLREDAVVDAASAGMQRQYDNVPREAKHASIRRKLLVGSVQTWTSTVETVSGEFVRDRAAQLNKEHDHKTAPRKKNFDSETVPDGDANHGLPSKRHTRVAEVQRDSFLVKPSTGVVLRASQPFMNVIEP
jgi:hypothetical protein